MNASTTIKAEPINENYEWLQYNEHLRIIHSIKDDMFQVQSIVNACQSKKRAFKWFENKSTKELIEFMGKTSSLQIRGDEKIFENRDDLSNELKGIYIHRLLVNNLAIWASPKYALFIAKLLDDHFTKQREQLSKKIESMRPRQVPKNKEKNYKYMIYLTDVPPDDENSNEDMVLLNLVRRNKSTFREVSKIKNSDKCWIYRDNLPISMTVNDDIKEIVKLNLPASEYDIKGASILTYREHLDMLKQKINDYLDNFQQ